MYTMCGTPFICSFDRQRHQPLDFLGGVAGPLRDDLHHRRRKIRIGVHGHALERERARDDDEHGQHQHQEALAESELNDVVNHRSRVPLRSALQRILELQEQAAVAHHRVARLQAGQ